MHAKHITWGVQFGTSPVRVSEVVAGSPVAAAVVALPVKEIADADVADAAECLGWHPLGLPGQDRASGASDEGLGLAEGDEPLRVETGHPVPSSGHWT